MYDLIKFFNLCLQQKESNDNDKEYLLWIKNNYQLKNIKKRKIN